MNHSRLSKIIVAVLLTGGLAGVSVPCYADESADLKAQVKTLQERVAQLEQQLAGSKAPTAAPLIIRANHPMYMDQWDPFAEMRMMQQQMNQLMPDQMIDFNPREDIKQTADAYIISMDIPGMEKDNISVEVKNGSLIVSGERKGETKEDRPNQYHRQERYFGHFYRTMPLPEDAKADAIDAKYENGVLTVKVERKKAPSKADASQKIKIK